VLYKVITDRQILQSCRDFPSITMMAVQSCSNQARDSLGSDTGSSRGRCDDGMKYNHKGRQTASLHGVAGAWFTLARLASTEGTNAQFLAV
jgi:hypothetical protein